MGGQMQRALDDANTQYTEGDTEANIIGTAIMWEDTGDTLRPVSASKPLPVDITEPKTTTSTFSSVAGSATSVLLLALNTARLGATFINDSTSPLYLKLGATASTSSYTAKLYQDDYYEVPFRYTGIIEGLWDSATGNVRVNELTA